VQNRNKKIIINIFLQSPWTQSAFCELNKFKNNTFNYIRNGIENIVVQHELEHKPTRFATIQTIVHRKLININITLCRLFLNIYIRPVNYILPAIGRRLICRSVQQAQKTTAKRKPGSGIDEAGQFRRRIK